MNIDKALYRAKLKSVGIKRMIYKMLGLYRDPRRLISQYAGTSYPFGKAETIELIQKLYPDKSATVLDVGPGRGIYRNLLSEKGYSNIDAVEIYEPYIEAFKLRELYRNLYHKNVIDFEYEKYDVVIFGDVLEHIEVKSAQKVISYAKRHSGLIVVSVPYCLEQIGTQVDGSGDHQQEDLTKELFLERYEGFRLLVEDEKLGIFYYTKK